MSSYIPPQHGAWAFLALPLLLAAVVAPWSPLLVILTVARVAAYPLSYAAFGLVRARRPQRFRRPFLVWAAVVAPAAAILVVWRPWLLWVGVAYAVLFAVNLAFAGRNRERDLLNDLVFIVECAGMVWVTWAVAAGGRDWSVALASVVVAAGLGAGWGWPRGLWLVIPFLAMAVRAFVVGRGPLRPGRIGMVELGCFLLVPICAALA